MDKGRVYLGSDHAGFMLKKSLERFLEQAGDVAKDLRTVELDADDDYPDYAEKVCRMVKKDKAKGILICGSGQGMDRAANKMRGIQASVCWNKKSAMSAKKHGNVNVLCLGEQMVSKRMAERIVRIWLEEPFRNEARHLRRIRKTERLGAGVKK